jgi:hypothetical protein
LSLYPYVSLLLYIYIIDNNTVSKFGYRDIPAIADGMSQNEALKWS